MSVTHYQFDGENLTGLIRCAAQAKGRCVAAANRNGFNNRARPAVFGKGVMR